MGYYATACKACGGPAIFFSVGSMWIDCGLCKARAQVLTVLSGKVRRGKVRLCGYPRCYRPATKDGHCLPGHPYVRYDR